MILEKILHLLENVWICEPKYIFQTAETGFECFNCCKYLLEATRTFRVR